MLNIDNLTKEQLLELRVAIDKKMRNFWTDVDAIAAFEWRRDKVTADYDNNIDKIKKDSPEINGMRRAWVYHGQLQKRRSWFCELQLRTW